MPNANLKPSIPWEFEKADRDRTNMNQVFDVFKRAVKAFSQEERKVQRVDREVEYARPQIHLMSSLQPIRHKDVEKFYVKIKCFSDFDAPAKDVPAPETVMDWANDQFSESGVVGKPPTGFVVKHHKLPLDRRLWDINVWDLDVEFEIPFGPIGVKELTDRMNDRSYWDELNSGLVFQRSWFYRTGEKVTVPGRKTYSEAVIITTYRRPPGIGGYLIMLESGKVVRASKIQKYYGDLT